MNKLQLGNENEYVVRLAVKRLADDEYWTGNVDSRLWAKAIAMTNGASKNLRPAISEDCVLYVNLLTREHNRVFDRYCGLRGAQIFTEIQCWNPALKKEIEQVKEIHKLYTRHHQFDHLNYPSRHTKKYTLVLLIVILIAILLGVNGA